LNYAEDSTSEVDMNVVMTGQGALIEIQGTAERQPFAQDMLYQLLSLAQQGIQQLIATQHTVLGLPTA
jgi:ribonuclease PH